MSRLISSFIRRMPWSGARNRTVISSQLSVIRQKVCGSIWPTSIPKLLLEALHFVIADLLRVTA